MIELKPCPFCSANPLLYDLLDTHGGFSVECPTDGCDTEKMKRTKDEAIAAWNRRTPQPTRCDHLTAADVATLKARIATEPGFALGLLVDAGICNRDGTLTEQFGGGAKEADHG